MKRIAVLGSTGSVGTQALSLLGDPRRARAFDVVALAAHRSERLLVRQAQQHAPAAACLVAGDGRPSDLPAATAWHSGADGVLAALEQTRPDLVLNAITGAAGLAASEWTLRRGTTLALANKESLVMAGPHLMALAAESGATVLPVDSEHCAIFQCLQGNDRGAVRKVWITGSGGPFRQRPLDSFAAITVEEALRHPTWDMGPRITVGSATMMNKAFEVIEAHWLFGLDPDRIEVVLHPQSVVHSMVEFVDGSILAQLGVPDMRVPILYCLSYPARDRFDGFEPFHPVRCPELTFAPFDPLRYPALPLAWRVLERGGDSGATLNAADEVATAAFLAGKLPFPAISRLVASVLEDTPARPISGLADVVAADAAARIAAQAALEAVA